MNAIPWHNPDNIDAHEVVDTTTGKWDVCCESVSKRTGLKMAMVMTAVLATNWALWDGLPKYESPLWLDYNELVPDEKLRKILIDTNLEKDLIAYYKERWDSDKRILMSVRWALQAFSNDSTNDRVDKEVWAASEDTFVAFINLDSDKFKKLHKIWVAFKKANDSKENLDFARKLSDQLTGIWTN